MNRTFPTLIINSRSFSKMNSVDSFSDSLKAKITELEDKLSAERDYLKLHQGYLEENRQKYTECLANPSMSKATCDTQVLPNVSIEDQKVRESEGRIVSLQNELSAKNLQLTNYLKEKAKTDPNALDALNELEGKKSSKTIIIVVSVLVALGIIAGMYFYYNKKSK